MIHITVRKQKLKDGNHSLYLDITGGGEQRKKYLGFKIYAKPKTDEQRKNNQDYTALANAAASKMLLELRTADQGLNNAGRRDMDFMDYFKAFEANYQNKDPRKVIATRKKLLEYLKLKNITSLPGRSITINFCEGFGEYLKRELNGYTPKNYFGCFRQVLIMAKKDGIVTIDSRDIEMRYRSDSGAIKKQLLSSAEVTALEAVECHNKEVKRAFLFSLNTGFDFATVNKLEWRQFEGNSIVFDRSKTGRQNRFPLNQKAIDLLGPAGKPNQLIFKLGTWEGVVKAIRAWAKAAGIDKKLTYHSARHSFGYRLRNEHKIDLSTLQELLGHSDIRTTKRYEHLNDEVKREAVNLL